MSTVTASIAASLPEHCLAHDRINGGNVTILRGKLGSAPTASNESPEAYNYRLGLTYEQVDAMEYGSVLGFDIPLADPDYIRQLRSELGQPIGPLAAPHAPPELAPQAACAVIALVPATT